MSNLGKLSRILILIASLLLGLSFIFPLWQIEIWAPQYPEGLFLQIWTSKIAGDIRNINILNHYIGMHPIKPDDIPELVYFPKVFGALLIFGLLTAAVGKRVIFYLWSTSLFAFSLAALYDFYDWEYRYGHELNPDAAIKMEGMSYQPPLIGSKELLNITAWSLPHIAGIAFTLAIGLVGLVYFLEFYKGRVKETPRAIAALGAVAFLALSTQSCTPRKPEIIALGQDTCHSCKMVITDGRYGGEVIMPKGKVYKFDAIECMVSFLKNNQESGVRIFVSDSSHPGSLIPAESATFVINDQLRSPMGVAILASQDAGKLHQLLGGVPKEVLKWNDLLKRLEKTPGSG